MNTPDPNEICYQPSHLRNNQFKNSPPPPSDGVIDPQLTLMHSQHKTCPVSETRVSVSISSQVDNLIDPTCVNVAMCERGINQIWPPSYFSLAAYIHFGGEVRQVLSPTFPYSEKLEINPYIGKE